MLKLKDVKSKLKQHTLSEIITYVDMKYGLGALETLVASNWFNPLATFWLNFRSLPIMQVVRFPIFAYGRPRLYCLSGRIVIDGRVKSGMIKFNQCKPGAPSVMSVQSEINNKGTIIFHGEGLIGTGTKIFVEFGTKLEIGKNFKITDMCNIGCFSGIKIGEQSRIAHRCQILDSNYHYVANFSKMKVPVVSKPIEIGKGCWICNSTTITGGSFLPDFTIVASNSLVGKDFSNIPNSSLIGGIPAKLIATGFRKVENSEIEEEIGKFYANHQDRIFEIPEDADKENYSFVDYYK